MQAISESEKSMNSNTVFPFPSAFSHRNIYHWYSQDNLDPLDHCFKDISLPKQRNKIPLGAQKCTGNAGNFLPDPQLTYLKESWQGELEMSITWPQMGLAILKWLLPNFNFRKVLDPGFWMHSLKVSPPEVRDSNIVAL